MGKIPAVNRMVSTVILNPKNGDDLTPLTTFNIQVNVANMQLGSFTNATSTYYAAPQDLNGAGNIIGHTHVTVQDTGNTMNPTQPLDATQFAFFKGINDAGNGQGLLTTPVTGGLPVGCYRLCTMSSASNHQPVLMPVAQRGSQEDCRYFSVGGACGNGGNNANAGNNNAGNGKGKNTGNNAANGQNNAGAATGNNANTGNNNANTGKGKNTGNNAANNAGAAAGNAAANNTAADTGNQNQNQGKNTNQNAGKGKNAGNAANNAAASNNANAGAAAGAIAGKAAPAVEDTGDAKRPFSVNGNTFATKAAAVQRACAIQNNACADAVNSGAAKGSSVADCNKQETACRAAGGA